MELFLLALVIEAILITLTVASWKAGRKMEEKLGGNAAGRLMAPVIMLFGGCALIVGLFIIMYFKLEIL